MPGLSEVENISKLNKRAQLCVSRLDHTPVGGGHDIYNEKSMRRR